MDGRHLEPGHGLLQGVPRLRQLLRRDVDAALRVSVVSSYSGPSRHPRRLYTAEQTSEARTAWATGHFSDEWRPWRHLAAMEGGIIAPPEGSRWDQWDDENPSQRAMLIRAIRETPELLRGAIRTAPRPTWGAVLEVLLSGRDQMARRLDDEQRDVMASRDEPTPQEAAAVLRRINSVLDPSDRARVIAEVRGRA